MIPYRDLPLRIGEIAHDFRFEASGTLKGIERGRHFCQNDSHLFVTPEQIKSEVGSVVDLVFETYKDFGIDKYRCVLSLRDPADKVKYHQDDEMWERAENALREVLNELHNVFVLLLNIAVKISSAEQHIYDLRQFRFICGAAGEHIVFGNAADAFGDEVHNELPLPVGDITDEMLAVRKRAVLHIIEALHHIVADEQLHNAAVLYYISRVFRAQFPELFGAAVTFLLFRRIAALLRKLIYHHVLFRAEHGIERLARHIGFLADTADAYFREAEIIQQPQHRVSYELLGL